MMAWTQDYKCPWCEVPVKILWNGAPVAREAITCQMCYGGDEMSVSAAGVIEVFTKGKNPPGLPSVAWQAQRNAFLSRILDILACRGPLPSGPPSLAMMDFLQNRSPWPLPGDPLQMRFDQSQKSLSFDELADKGDLQPRKDPIDEANEAMNNE